ncbi:MAG: VC2046/SO_2500 family protein [Succinivibrio sp.]
MLTHEIRKDFLVDELQLGQRLNQDVQSSNHADFSLMLCMLSQDVTDNPLFADSENKIKEVNLRAKFHLPAEQKKYADVHDFDRAQRLTEMFANDGMCQVFLSQCLTPEPLTPYERTYAPEVFSQLPPLKQEKLRRQMEGAVLSYEAIKETGDGFDVIDEINSSRLIAKIEAAV